jgi:hypothetical protein
MIVSYPEKRTYERNITFTANTNITNDTNKIILAQGGDDAVYGFIKSNTDPPSLLREGTAFLYDWENNRFLSSEIEGTYFRIPAYRPGTFMLVVDAPGHAPFYEYKIELNDQNKNQYYEEILLEPVEDETITTTIDFGNDWNTTAFDTTWTLNADSRVYGLEHSDKGDLRFQIDFENVLWQGDRSNWVEGSERTEFETYLDDRGPCHVTTKNILKVNNSKFVPSMIGGKPDYSIATTFVDREITSDKTITLNSKTNYIIEEGVAQDSIKVYVGKLRANENIKMTIPKNYEIESWAPSSAEVELISFYNAYINSSDVELTVNKVVGPTAKITVTGDYVKPLDEINFDGNGSSDASGRGIKNWTWDFKDGTLGYGPELKHNFSKPGLYQVTLKVTDSSDMTDSIFYNISVDLAKPTPRFILEDNESVELPKDPTGTYYIADEEQVIHFNATTSSDTLDGTSATKVDLLLTDLRTFTWEFGDGQADNGPEVNNWYKFQSWEAHKDDPFYTIKLNVTDRAGNFKIAEQRVKINDITPPVPSINRVSAIDIGETIEWNASESFDTFDHTDNLTYTWDFGDNITGTGKVIEHLYDTPGAYTATLNVTDQSGNWEHATSVQLSVRGVNLAITNIYFDKTKVKADEKLHIQVNITNSQFGQTSGADANDITISLFKDGKSIGTQTLDYLAYEGFEIINFTWKASGDVKTYTMRANITLINSTWELNWEDNERERKIDLEETPSDVALYITIVLIIVVIVVFVLIFLRRRGYIGLPKKSRRRDRSDKRKGKKEK